MSRIGRLPVAIPEGVTVTVAEGNKVTRSSDQTERSEKNEIFTRFDKNPDFQHGNWCTHWL